MDEDLRKVMVEELKYHYYLLPIYRKLASCDPLHNPDSNYVKATEEFIDRRLKELGITEEVFKLLYMEDV